MKKTAMVLALCVRMVPAAFAQTGSGATDMVPTQQDVSSYIKNIDNLPPDVRQRILEQQKMTAETEAESKKPEAYQQSGQQNPSQIPGSTQNKVDAMQKHAKDLRGNPDWTTGQQQNYQKNLTGLQQRQQELTGEAQQEMERATREKEYAEHEKAPEGRGGD